jgi:hypothetical protein
MSSCSSHRAAALRRGLGAAVLALAAATPLVAQPKPTPAPGEPAGVERLERFHGTVRIADKDVSVAIDTWLIPSGQKVAALPLPLRGPMVVELRGGTVVTIIGGKRVKRRPGEFWTVPAASSMALETEDDSAAIATTVLRE